MDDIDSYILSPVDKKVPDTMLTVFEQCTSYDIVPTVGFLYS